MSAPRMREVAIANPATVDADERLVAFLLELLGGTEVRRTAKGPQPTPIAHTASSADQVTIRAWRVDATACSIEIERTYVFFPGDVNERAVESEDIRVVGTTHDGARSVRLHVRVGASTIVTDAADDTDSLLAAVF